MKKLMLLVVFLISLLIFLSCSTQKKVDFVNLDKNKGYVIGEGEYERGSKVLLEAFPNEGYKFIKWVDSEGNFLSKDNPYSFIMSKDNLTIEPVFEIKTYSLNIEIEGKGNVEIYPQLDKYPHGTEIMIKAIPDENTNFVKWEGDLTGNLLDKSFTIKENMDIKPVFDLRGKGTIEDPYLIFSANQLNMIRKSKYLNKHFKQMDDIDLSEYENWEPIGYGSTRTQNLFSGTYDGNGYEIRNLNIDRKISERGYEVGLFNQITEEAILKNISLVNVNIFGGSYTGGLVGYNNGIIEQCFVEGNIEGNDYVGGIAGMNFGWDWWGGDGIIKNSYSIVNIEGEQWLGGIAGFSYSGKIINCYTLNDKELSGTTTSGITNSFINSNLLEDTSMQNNYLKTTREMMEKTTFNNWDFENIWDIDEGKSFPYLKTQRNIPNYLYPEYKLAITNHPSDISNKIIESEKYYLGDKVLLNTFDGYVVNNVFNEDTNEIIKLEKTKEHKYYFNMPNSNTNISVELIKLFAGGNGTKEKPYLIESPKNLNNVRFFLNEDNVFYKQIANIDLSEYENWLPIGNNQNRFAGTYDGNGCKITNLTINRPDENYIGLFGYADKANLINIGLENVDVVGNNYVGGLAGYSRGFIEKSYVAGNIKGNDYVGSVLGSASNCYIINVYSVAKVVGNERTGGLIGYKSRGELKNSYFAGEVSNEYVFNNLIGAAVNPKVENSFFIKSYYEEKKSEFGLEKEFYEMVQKETFNNWDFDKVWNIVNKDGYVSYPYLINNNQKNVPGLQSFFSGGNGTKENPYLLETAEQLNQIRFYLNREDIYFKQIGDIDLSEYDNWEPIGYGSTRTQNLFSGTYDGNGYEIRNLNINKKISERGYEVGLFNKITTDAILKNISLVNVNIFGWDFTGGLVGYNDGIIEQCFVEGNIVGNDYVGGIAGWNSEIIKNSYSVVNIQGERWLGGIAGFSYSGKIINCYTLNDKELSGTTTSGITNSFINSNLLEDTSMQNNYLKTTREMMEKTTFNNWDFENIWDIDEGKSFPYLKTQRNIPNYLYPEYKLAITNHPSDISNKIIESEKYYLGDKVLLNTFDGYVVNNVFNEDTNEIIKLEKTKEHKYYFNMPNSNTNISVELIKLFAGGNGTIEDPYQISSSKQLNDIRNHLEYYYIQIANIDLLEYDNWEPIGNYDNKFIGNYDGKGYKITNLNINRPDEDYIGLFGYIENSNMQNIKLEKINIKGHDFVGGLTGDSSGGIINNIFVSGSVEGNNWVGGIAGLNYFGTIIKSYVEGEIKGNLVYVNVICGQSLYGNEENNDFDKMIMEQKIIEKDERTRWSAWTIIDPLTDLEQIFIRNSHLTIRRMSSRDIIFSPNEFLGNNKKIELRFDKEKAKSYTWNSSTDMTALRFLPCDEFKSAKDFVKKLLTSSELVVGYNPYNKGLKTNVYDIKGLGAVLLPYLESFGWEDLKYIILYNQ